MQIERMTKDEHARLAACEKAIDANKRGFIAVAEALVQIRDERLYRRTHPTFEEYCRERWDMTFQRAYQLIEAHGVHSALRIDTQPWLSNERQIREISKVHPEAREEVIDRAISTAPKDERGKPKLTAKAIREANEPVERVRASTRTENTENAVPERKNADLAQERFTELLRMFREIKGEVKALRRDGHFGHVSNSFDAALSSVERTVKDALPFAYCPACKGAGCIKCMKRGWLIRIEFQQLDRKAQGLAVML